MVKVNYNERSWAIDLITDINLWLSKRSILIKKAGGENTLQSGSKLLFPDILLFGDNNKGRILQGWELKMPDTPLNDAEFIKNAKTKAKLLSLNSFLLWNVSSAILYKIEDDDTLTTIKTWNNLSHIKTREEVPQNKAGVDKMLTEILNDLSSFISSGTIKTTSVVTALSSEAVSGLIHNNLSSYVEALKDATKGDSDFSDKITLWWRYAKNDYPEEKDKFVVLSRNNLLFLVNKFLFAHILKSYQADANAVDTIDHSTDIKTAFKIFNKISEKCDFWNIFQSQKGEEFITPEVWQDILNFNDLLKEFDFSKIKKTLLHDLISSTVYKNKRKFAGQFTTPSELAKFITQLTIKNKTLPAIDPCCGTGTIAKEIYNIKKQQIGFKKGLATTWASDKFSLPLQMAMFNLSDPEALGSVIRIFKEDATKLRVNQKIKLREPFKGSVIIEKLPKFGYILSNLPFVQQEDLKILNPTAPKINTTITENLGNEYRLDGRSDLYAYLPFYFWNLLDKNGRLAIIVSNAWLGTTWGRKFYQALGGFYNIEVIITSGSGRWFQNTKVVTNIIILKKKNTPILPKPDEITKFVVTKKKLAEYTPEVLSEIVAIISSVPSIDEEDISVRSHTYEQITQIKDLGLSLNSFFSDTNWILKLNNKLVKISSLFTIGRGERRGWDKLFYPEANNGIEKYYLKPVLKTPRSIDGLVAKPDSVAFCCDKSKEELKKLGHNGALAWINKFEGQTNEKGVSLTKSLVRKGIYWYTMLPTTMAEMVTSINFGDRLFFARFSKSTFVNQRLIRFSRKSVDIDDRLCHALMNSLIGLFYIEAMGIGRGEGVLDLNKDKIENDLHIINPSLIGKKNRDKILSLFAKLETREIFSIEKELEQEDRKKFDNAVLDAIGFLLHKEDIKNALLTLYKIRLAVKK